jgi:glycosyltransferase involved in cell wall biosynthesis
MSDMTTVSVLLPVHNASRYIAQAVESILAQTHGDFELLALDDGSTDDSLLQLRRYEARDSRVRVVSRPNTGIVGALNDLVALAKSDWLFRMDADDIARPKRFERQLSYLKNNPDCVALGSRALFIDPEGLPIHEYVDCFDHAAIERTLLLPDIGILHPTVVMNRSALLAVGGYRADYPHVEDLDLFLRLGEQGLLANIPEVLLDYRVHVGSVTHSHTVVQHVAGLRVVRDVCARRGLSFDRHDELLHPRAQSETTSSLHRKWAWWALGAGNLGTARKHAFRALLPEPGNWENWRVLACAWRGH